ncbi:Transmembrane protein [Quillaja saponaria]|uniref:Transmembrane protein n=1 Tax=Quillaja saponaria TaxID=32244 RepID=A0AAD7Q1Y6_QUISA|nr:Transmembrane protein [Quillaja saponaria]
MHTVMFKAQCFVLEHSFLINPVSKMNNSLQQNFAAPNCPCSSSLLSLSYRIQPQRSIISCARKNKRRSGSQRSRNFVLKMVSIVALNLKIIPQPLDLVIGEFVGDDGNGGDLRTLDGWRRKRKLKLLPYWVHSDILLGFVVWKNLGGLIVEGFGFFPVCNSFDSVVWTKTNQRPGFTVISLECFG